MQKSQLQVFATRNISHQEIRRKKLNSTDLFIIRMLRKTAIRLCSAKSNGRTIVRDPRKKKSFKLGQPSAVVEVTPEDKVSESNIQPTPTVSPLSFGPSSQNQESVGSALGSYALAGVGITLGFTLVKLINGV